jgi:hypothetical protein
VLRRPIEITGFIDTYPNQTNAGLNTQQSGASGPLRLNARKSTIVDREHWHQPIRRGLLLKLNVLETAQDCLSNTSSIM